MLFEGPSPMAENEHTPPEGGIELMSTPDYGQVAPVLVPNAEGMKPIAFGFGMAVPVA